MTQTYRGLTLDPFQREAIAALQAGHSVLVAAPTGTGKTIIADWIVEEALRTGGEVIYTAPIKALSNQKFRDYVRLYGEDQVGLVTGDLVIRHGAPCRVMTTEVLRNMLLTGDPLPRLRAVILDEIHFLDDRDRGTVWEEVLIHLPATVQIVGLSATLSNLNDFAAWLEWVRDRRVVTVTETQRAVPLRIRYASVDTGLQAPAAYARVWKRKQGQIEAPARGRRGRGRGGGGGRGRGARRTTHIDLHRMAADEELLPYLYFVFSRRDTEVCARRLGEEIDGLLDPESLAQLDAMLDARAGDLGSALDPALRNLYRQGIAYHHAGLHVKLKALVEELYEARLIRVLYCTSTFALGINMPARAVIFDGLRKFDGRGFAPLTTRQFMQKAGRAGRRGLDEAGDVILRVDVGEYEEAIPQLERYAQNRVEPVRSTFNLSWNSVVNLLARHPLERCREIVEKSFLNWWRERQADRLEQASAAGKQDRRLQRRASRDRGRCWAEFEHKVRYLQHIGYLDAEGGFNAGAAALRSLQISEILLTELVLEGVFEGLQPSLLFGLLCALTNELPRHARRNFRPRGDERALAERVGRIRFSPVVTDAEAMGGEQYAWDPDLIHLGRAWAEGRPLEEILLEVESDTDIAGDLITGFRRAKDLAGQLKEALAEDPARAEALGRLVRVVSRDEVEVVG